MFSTGLKDAHINRPLSEINLSILSHIGQGVIIKFFASFGEVVSVVTSPRFLPLVGPLCNDHGDIQKIIKLPALMKVLIHLYGLAG